MFKTHVSDKLFTKQVLWQMHACKRLRSGEAEGAQPIEKQSLSTLAISFPAEGGAQPDATENSGAHQPAADDRHVGENDAWMQAEAQPTSGAGKRRPSGEAAQATDREEARDIEWLRQKWA